MLHRCLTRNRVVSTKLGWILFVSIAEGGCLDRPVAPATPTVTARVTEPAKQDAVDKVDLLFMIDNSSSMADKQSILALAVPDVVDRFVNPTCVDPVTFAPLGATPSDPTAPCPTSGAEREFHPLNSIHIGIITSSLGNHGATGVCDDTVDAQEGRLYPHNNDHGELIARGPDDAPVDTGNATVNGANNPNASIDNFLNFSSGDANTAGKQDTFQNMVIGTGQHGCGYEAQLEAPYRFLVDPEPPTGVSVDTTKSLASPTGLDTTLLQQRADFLRPNSLVAVIILTDENDCSIDDGGQGYLSITPAKGGHTSLLHGTSQCKTNPNDPCCQNCGVATNPGCPDISNDPECQAGAYTSAVDTANLRCWHQKQRYGIDFLTGIQKYIDGYTQPTITKRDGTTVTNPLFDDLTCPPWQNGSSGAAGSCTKQPSRDPSLVFVAGIVGVPWQDVARRQTDAQGNYVKDDNGNTIPDLTLGFMTAKELRDNNVWPMILPQNDPGLPNHTTDPPVDPTDPLMIESIDVRTQTTTSNPLGGAALPKPPDSADMANPVNGHEWDISHLSPPNSDLQYACVFDLPTPRDCSTKDNAPDCDCAPGSNGDVSGLQAEMNPLCYQNGAYGSTQVRAKGYPGIRELQVLQGVGDQGIVASICPKQVSDSDPSAVDYGYRPAVSALIERLRTALRGRCLPRQLAVDPDSNTVPCVVYEAYTPEPGSSCDCGGSGSKYPGRAPADMSDLPDEITSIDPMPTCVCTIHQLTQDPALTSCETDGAYAGGSDDSTVGWCYVDPIQQADLAQAQGGDLSEAKAACAIVANCPATERRLIRFVGAQGIGDPRPNSTSVIECQEATFSVSGSGDQNQNICNP